MNIGHIGPEKPTWVDWYQTQPELNLLNLLRLFCKHKLCLLEAHM